MICAFPICNVLSSASCIVFILFIGCLSDLGARWRLDACCDAGQVRGAREGTVHAMLLPISVQSLKQSAIPPLLCSCPQSARLFSVATKATSLYVPGCFELHCPCSPLLWHQIVKQPAAPSSARLFFLPVALNWAKMAAPQPPFGDDFGFNVT